MIYFYARVSSREQNLARQLEAAKQFPVDRIFQDKESGKDFNRTAYQEMKRILVSGDTVIVKSLDRLGRNKEATKEEMKWFKENHIILRVLDLPTTMIEYPAGQEWVMEMINNILVEVISTIAEQERRTIRSRQREGIDAMPLVNGKRYSTKKHTAYGRKPLSDSDEIMMRIELGESWDEIGISRASWYRYRKMLGVTSADEFPA